MAELALDQKRKGKTVLDYAEEMYRQFGYFANLGVSVAMTGIEGKQQMAAMMDSLRQSPPKTIGGMAVTGFEDLRDPEGKFGPIKGVTDAASRNVLLFAGGQSWAGWPCVPAAPSRRRKPTSKPGGKDKADVDVRAKTMADDFVQQATARAG